MNLFIVEDSNAVREQMQALVSGIPGVVVVGYANDEMGAIEGINTLLPDTVTLDLCLQTGSGINVLEDIKKQHPNIKVIVLTNYNDTFYSDRCMRAGADYFFDKTLQITRFYWTLWKLSNGSHNRQLG